MDRRLFFVPSANDITYVSALSAVYARVRYIVQWVTVSRWLWCTLLRVGVDGGACTLLRLVVDGISYTLFR